MEETYHAHEPHQLLSAHSDDSNDSTSTVMSPSAPHQSLQESDPTPILHSAKHSHGNRAGTLAQNAPDDSSRPLIHVSDKSHVGNWGCEGLALRQTTKQDTKATLPVPKHRQTFWPLKTYPKPSMDETPEILVSKKPMQSKGFASPVDTLLTRSSAYSGLQVCSRWVWLLIITVALYSTVMSGLWFAIAAKKPRWGHYISSTGFVTPTNATPVFALLAKSIEITFVTTFVAYLGQELTRKACSMKSEGVSVAEMSMRTWFLQPGSMITHWASFRITAPSTIGLITFFATWSVLLYTPASSALGNSPFTNPA